MAFQLSVWQRAWGTGMIEWSCEHAQFLSFFQEGLFPVRSPFLLFCLLRSGLLPVSPPLRYSKLNMCLLCVCVHCQYPTSKNCIKKLCGEVYFMPYTLNADSTKSHFSRATFQRFFSGFFFCVYFVVFFLFVLVFIYY